MSNDRIERAFPGLQCTHYRVTSPQDRRYNCIAWAASDPAHWWWPVREPRYAWPLDAPAEETLSAFTIAFESLGYRRCETAEHEVGFEKVAVYANANGTPTHAARQLRSGRWTSKLGPHVDIEHEIGALEGDEYGKVGLIMKRPTEPTSKNKDP